MVALKGEATLPFSSCVCGGGGWWGVGWGVGEGSTLKEKGKTFVLQQYSFRYK